MKQYNTHGFVDGKVRHIIVDENGKIINRSPNKEELKGLEKESYKNKSHAINVYTDEELLNYFKQFYEENRRVPAQKDFADSPEYPDYKTYKKRFGSWSNALKLVGLDIDTMVKNGIIETSIQKARYAEIKVINHFKRNPVDLAGENCNSPCNGICPNGKTYDVKSSKLRKEHKRYEFNIHNKYKEEIEIYYFLVFNDEDYTKLRYAWRVPGEIVEKNYFQVGLNSWSRGYTIDNMKEYDITDKFESLFKASEFVRSKEVEND